VWGRVVYRRRRAILALSALALAAAVGVLVRGGTLGTGTIEGIESARGLRRIEEALGRPGESGFTVIFRSATLPARAPAFADAMRAALAPLRADPRVLSVRSPEALPGPLADRYYAKDGSGAIAVVALREELRAAGRSFPELRALVRADALEVTFTGHLAFKTDLDAVLQRDLVRAEVLSVPLAIVVLLAVFGSLVASGLPAGVGTLAVVSGVACITALSRVMDMAQYAINVCSLIGLGVAIDYSLFIVSRYRDERAHGHDVEEALARTMATAGRTVVFSGLAVGVGLAGLLFFPRSYMEAMGIAGALVVLLAMVFALTFLPALLAVLGPGVEAGRVPIALGGRGAGFWRALAHRVMRRPLLVLVPTLALVLATGSPFLRLRLAAADISVLPRAEEARRGHEWLRAHVPDEVATRIAVVVDFPSGSPLTRERVGELFDLSRRIARIPHVARVEGLLDLHADMEREDYQDLWGVPPEEWPATLRPFVPETVGRSTILLSAVTAAAPSSEEARAIVRAVRAERRVGDGTLLVTGQTANDVDSMDFILERSPRAIAFVMGMTALILFGLLGSVVIPLKAIVMNLLSIAGSFGALVWIFQEGHGAAWLGFEPGPIEPTLPILLFCCVFGLSMDYEVLLLCRMQEEWERSRDNARAVAEGLERSGRLITSAAAIMVAVFASFAIADVVLIKAMGLGMAIAVALDATLVRVLIVPATMRLFGDWNWWAPGPLARLAARIGAGRGHRREE
jgi:RND superfamily putative drug exporter